MTRARKAPTTAGVTDGSVSTVVANRVATITFGHPKSNALPGALLERLSHEIASAGANREAAVIVLRSEGGGAFCAGASFDELTAISNAKAGATFFSGFAHMILAMIRVPKLVLTRVQGKVAGGGVGILAASDYVLALRSASVRLSELALGIGPFVVGPAIERKIGLAAFSAMAVDTEWRDAEWCERHGLHTRLFDDAAAMDAALDALAVKLAHSNPEAMARLKAAFWAGTEGWERTLIERAKMSGKLVLSEFTRRAIAGFRSR